jgi:hypothetical protein
MQIVIALFDRFASLDAVGPFQVAVTLFAPQPICLRRSSGRWARLRIGVQRRHLEVRKTPMTDMSR